MVRILIVDDHAVVRSGLKQFLVGNNDCAKVEEAGSGSEALALVTSSDWDVVLLDIGLPDLNGIEVLKRIKQMKPGLPVLIFSMFAEDDYAMTALEGGAAGFLSKDSSPEEIVDAIHRVSTGAKYLSPGLTEKLLSGSLAANRKLPHEFLSNRETEVLRLLSRGESLTEIGRRLCLSPKTVTTYRTRILDKLQVASNAELTRYVVKHKLDAL